MILLAGCDGVPSPGGPSPAAGRQSAASPTTSESIESEPGAQEAASTDSPDVEGAPVAESTPKLDVAEEETQVSPPTRPDPRRRFTPLATAEAPSRRSALPSRSGEITFDDLKFDIEPDQPYEPEMLTSKVEGLVGRRIRIQGFMYPTTRQTGITRFILVRDNMECCFGPGAALYDCIYVAMAPGRSAEYSIAPVAVEGEFTIDERRGPDGRPTSIFHLVADEVR